MQGRYDDEGFSALDIPTSAALAYVREHAARAAKSARPAREARAEAAATAARLLLVTDAACDIPSAWLHNKNVALVPVNIAEDGQYTRDRRDEAQSGQFALHLRQTPRARAVGSEPLSPTEIRDHLQSWMNNSIDYVLQLTFAASRSKLYVSSLAATQSLVLIHNKVRRSIGNRGPLNAWVIDSQTGLTGQALLLTYAVHLRDRGIQPAQIAPAVEALRRQVHTLMVPGDLRYVFQASQRKGESSLSRTQMLLGRWLDIKPLLYAGGGGIHSISRVRHTQAAIDRALSTATRHVELGLSAPTVCVSYAGDVEELVSMSSFSKLIAECRRRRTELITTTMSMTGCLKLGPGALSVSFASERFLP